MLTLHFTNTVRAPFTVRRFTSLLKTAEKNLPPIPEKEVELVLLDDEAMRVLNLQTRGMNKSTDVLSFATREIEDPTLRAQTTSLGQIFISLPAAQRNADEIGQSLADEVNFLFLHGFLHILGYDHHTSKDEAEMMGIAYKILGRPPFQSH